MRRIYFVAIVLLLAWLLPAHITLAQPQRAGSPLAQVRYIFHGLSVQPPRQGRHAGHTRDPLYDQYGLATFQSQKASVGFHDGTVLQLNQNTGAVLSGHLTHVQHGEVAEYLAPGTDHRVQTAAATASAIGTTFDVRTAGSTTVFVVLHGALQVANPKGAVVVKSNHETSVIQGHAPLPPSPVDAKAVFAWTDGIPTPDLGEDVALDANGGQVVSFSSQRQGPGDAGHVEHIDDGLLTTGWESASGKTRNQTVTVGFAGGSFYRISDIIIDPAATYGDPASEDLKDFAIRVSTTTSADASFTTVFQGTTARSDTLQHFHLPMPVRAKYVQLVAQDNYGSTQRVAVAEWEVVATASLFAEPTGLAVDAQGFLYVADTNANRIDKVDKRGQIVAHWGSKGSGPGQLLGPEGVAVAPNGNVYAADSGNDRIEEFSPIGRFLRTWGSQGIDAGYFQHPRGIAIDAKGIVYVADLSGDPANPTAAYLRVQKFSPTGRRLAVFNDLADAGQFWSSGDIAVDRKGDLWLTDYGANTIVKVSPTGTVLATIGSKGSTPGKFYGPLGISIDPGGNVFVADLFNDRVQRIGSGGFVHSWGTFGHGRGQYALPQGVIADGKGSVYVADSLNGRIQKLNARNGKVEAIWGKYASIPTLLGQPGGVAVDPQGDVWVTDSTSDRIQVRAPSGRVLAVLGYHGYVGNERNTKGLGQFLHPDGIAIGANGEAYVADSGNCRIQELAPRGPIGAIGTSCTKPRQFEGPSGVAVDRAGNIYVADAFGNQVFKFSPNGTKLWRYGVSGMGPGQLDTPYGIAVDSHGNVYVSNSANLVTGAADGRIVKLSSGGQVLDTWGTADPLLQSRFADPQGLFMDSHDHLFVADSAHSAIQELTTDGKVVGVFPLPNRSRPSDVALDARGNLYVADGPNQRVIKVAPTGEVLAIWS